MGLAVAVVFFVASGTFRNLKEILSNPFENAQIKLIHLIRNHFGHSIGHAMDWNSSADHIVVAMLCFVPIPTGALVTNKPQTCTTLFFFNDASQINDKAWLNLIYIDTTEC